MHISQYMSVFTYIFFNLESVPTQKRNYNSYMRYKIKVEIRYLINVHKQMILQFENYNLNEHDLCYCYHYDITIHSDNPDKLIQTSLF